MAQPYTEARKEGNKKWDSKNLDRISIAIPKGRKATVEACAKARGESVNGLVNALLMDATGLTEAEWKQPAADPLEEQEESIKP